MDGALSCPGSNVGEDGKGVQAERAVVLMALGCLGHLSSLKPEGRSSEGRGSGSDQDSIRGSLTFMVCKGYRG